MAEGNYQHIFLDGPSFTQQFTSTRRGRGDENIPPRKVPEHGAFLQRKFEEAWGEAEDRQAVTYTQRSGVYLEFKGEPGADLPVQSLEALRSHVRLLNTRSEGKGDAEQRIATVYVPNEKRSHFLKKFRRYAEGPDQGSSNPKNYKLANCISDIQLAVLESFWKDSPELIPQENPDWVEVWLSAEETELLPMLEGVLERHSIEKKPGSIGFPERTVILIWANREQLTCLIEECDLIAELRLAKEAAGFFLELENDEQVQWVEALLHQCRYNDDTNISVCILDGGVNNGHLLLQPVLEDGDLHTVDPDWGVNDTRKGHGTLMAGTVTYGDLKTALQSKERMTINHHLESVKILPPAPKQNPKELWGYLTAQGVYRPETQRPDNKRIICMAVTSTDDRDRGRPSSWSGELDNLSSGRDDGSQRLIIVSGGNVSDSECWRNYPDDNITNEIHDPGQAWNALTVGASTEKITIDDSALSGYEPLAAAGELSPFSTTSLNWQINKWPIKPEVVFEGGNVAQGPNDSLIDADDLQLLSTAHDPQTAQFARFNATSAAAAQAARMAAQIQTEYPETWPETVRGLLVHSAEWTEAMKEQFDINTSQKKECCKLLRICGYGVPNVERALYCAANSLTLISETKLQPYERREGRCATRDMHLYRLPWPEEILHELGETTVEMRVTLSYFVEPGPGEIGWAYRYRYPSHGLRFEAIGPTEAEDEFLARINREARAEEGEHPGTSGPSDKWLLGEGRNMGSIHSDTWTGTASDLASSNKIAVYPTVGWWRERHHLGRVESQCRYSLIVSISTPQQDVDIYTPVATKVGITVPVEVPVR